CLVPERREERTTEGGLDVAGQLDHVGRFVRALGEAGVRVSLFIDPDPAQVEAAARLGAAVIELHTGAYCEAYGGSEGDRLLETIRSCAALGAAKGLEIHAGHGLSFENVSPIAAIPEIRELNIGHFLIGEAIFTGLQPAIREMRRLMHAARAGA
ncbi:MAG TPA: pyridoxine 5'-phosphate synthase, partial [Terricaulis sp.]|nr:pyridoxine 5'-phosphate synthase [Terricaulis sp.]